MDEQPAVALSTAASVKSRPATQIDRRSALGAYQELAAPLITALAYYLSAKLGAWLAFPSAPVSALWAPNAILLAALLMARPERWWIFLLVLLPFHLAAQLHEYPTVQVLIQYVLNCSEALIAAILIRRLCDSPRQFETVRTVLALVLFGGLVAPLITSAVMAAAFAFLGLTRDVWLTILARTLTNTFAVVALVPLITHVTARFRPAPRGVPLARVLEACVLAVALIAVGSLVFALPLEPSWRSPALVYAPLPLLAWSAMRFGVPGACASALLLGVISTWGVLTGHGPFIAPDPVANALSVVAFHVVVCVALVMFAALLTEWRQTEAKRMRAESLHAAVLASVNNQLAVLDASGVILETNESWRRAVDADPGERFDRVATGASFLEACARGAREGNRVAMHHMEAVRSVLEGTELRRQLEFTASYEGVQTWIEVSIERLHRAEGGAVITRTDVTARKRAELEARSYRQQSMRLERAAVLGQLSGAFAHELNQPLTSILGNAEAAIRLLSREPVDPGEIREILADIIHDDERAAQVIRGLRALFKKGELVRGRVDLNLTIRDVLELARTEIIKRNVEVETLLGADLPPVMADRVQIQQALLNLVLNACEAMAEVAMALRRVTVATRRIEDGFVEITIHDTGCGIAPEALECIFQPFVTTKPDGLGLGLAICRSVAESHGGRLFAENAPEGGAVFRLRVPIEGGVS